MQKRRRKAERSASSGQSLVEYGLCLALISVVCITALNLMGTNLSDKLTCIAMAVQPAGAGGGAGGGGVISC